MRRIELVDGISSSALGFGCASILGAIDASTAKRALHCALDCGINHFDLARSYGYGQAEQFVGNILKGKRNEIIICSKFGIKANWKSDLLKPVKPLIRIIKNYKSKKPAGTDTMGLKSSLPVADRFHDRVALNEKEMRLSLETSLRQLKTDYLDYFLIHEPLQAVVNLDSLLATASQLKQQGKIRSFGLAFTLNQLNMHKGYLNEFDLLQFNKPVDNIEQNALAGLIRKPNILFSVMRDNANSGSAAERLKKAFNDFPADVILCSTFNTNHIKQNALLAQ